MRNINKVIVHCSFTPADMDVGVKEIRKWHTEAPRNWSDVGYHYVIRRDGTIEKGRPLERAGAHCNGHNRDSIGLCLVGGAKRNLSGRLSDEMNFTLEQYKSFQIIYDDFLHLEDDSMIEALRLGWHGHHEFTNKKSCPNFDVEAFIQDGTIKEYIRGED